MFNQWKDVDPNPLKKSDFDPDPEKVKKSDVGDNVVLLLVPLRDIKILYF